MKRNENMKVNGGLEYINDTLGIIDKIENILDTRQLKPIGVKKELETQCIESIRTIERLIKEATGFGPSEYIKRRALTKFIYDVNKDKKVTEAKIKNHNYKSKYTVNKECIKYFNVELDEVVKNIDKYKLQEKPTKESIYYKYILDEHSSSKRVLTEDSEDMPNTEIVKTRFMGRSAYIPSEDEDKINIYLFTKDLSSKLIDCKVDYHIFIRESELKEKIDFMFEKYKDEKPEIEELNIKINSFRHEDIITLRVADNKIVDIIDFYPKAKNLDIETVKNDIGILVDSIDLRIKKKLDLDAIIVCSGLEVLERIFRFRDGMSKRYNKNALVIDLDIFEFMFIYKEDMNILHNLIIDLSSIYVNYMNNKISKSKAKKEINHIMDKIVFYKKMLLRLEKVLEKAVENNYYIA